MMTDSELYKLLGIDRGTLYRWRDEEDKTDPKYRIYRILKRLPKEFIESTLRDIEEETSLTSSVTIEKV